MYCTEYNSILIYVYMHVYCIHQLYIFIGFIIRVSYGKMLIHLKFCYFWFKMNYQLSIKGPIIKVQSYFSVTSCRVKGYFTFFTIPPFYLSFIHYYRKELSFCHKLRFSNSCNLATRFPRQ